MDLKKLHLNKPYDFSGKVAVVTGANGVLCSPMTLALGQLGAAVVLIDLLDADKIVQQIESEGGKALSLQTNVTDKQSLAEASKIIRGKFGLVDILINGAGGAKKDATTSKDRSFFDLSEEAIRWVFDLNMMGTLLPCQIFGRDMAEKGSGTILNVISMAAYKPVTRSVAYSAAKAGAMNFTQWLAVHMAQEYSPQIRVNGIAPGIFLAGWNRFLLIDEKTGNLTERGQKFIDHTPMGRFGNPEELVGAMLLLLSDLGSYITGVTLNVDGGQAAYGGI